MTSLKARGNSEHRWYSFHLAGLGFATAMRLIPRHRRFDAALLLARAAVPLVRRTGAYQEQRRGNVDGVREIALHLVLNTLTKNGTEFDPLIIVNGREELRRAIAYGKGVLLISPHTVLSLLMVRFYHDAGYNPVFIAADPRMRVSGTTVTAETVQPSPTFLVAIKNRLRAGRLVCGMPDRAEHSEGRTLEFDTANGRIILATPLMQVAARCAAKVIFLKVHVDERGVVATMVAPSEASEGSADAITAEFIEFVRAHVASRFAGYNQTR
jgi:lauroyl/myristoyl acyltransferase